MSKKSQRLAAIRTLIETEAISSQEELLERLRQMGTDATQSTLSRDMKEIRAVKIPDARKGYIYMLPEDIQAGSSSDRTSSIITENILSVDFSGNIAVIKTNPGYANAVAALIDNESIEEIMGTIAGDDNILIVTRENASHKTLLDKLRAIHPRIKSLYQID